MTGYHARWNNVGIERSRVRTFARTLIPAGGPGFVPPPGLPEDPLLRVLAPHAWASVAAASHPGGQQGKDLFAAIRAALGEPASHRHATPSVARQAAPAEPALEPSNADIESLQSPSHVDAASSPQPQPQPSFDAASESEQRRERATEANAATEIAAATDVPGDFSDLIALGGPAPLDGDYHDFPAALHAAVPNHRGRPDDPSALLLDNEEADPLLKLAAEYERALQHDTSGIRHELKAGAAERPPSPALPDDPFDDPTLAPANQSVVDLLVVGQNIDTILDSLDSFGAERLFEDEKRQEILSLLAPQRPQRPMPPRASLNARLAREEHHQISVDSHIDVLATQSDAPPSDPSPSGT